MRSGTRGRLGSLRRPCTMYRSNLLATCAVDQRPRWGLRTPLLGSAALQRRLLSRLDSLPTGITVEGAPLRKGDEKCAIWCAIVIPARWRTLRAKRGVAPSTFSPILRHHLRRTEGGRAGHSRAALGGRDAGKPAACNGFPEKDMTTTGRASTSERGGNTGLVCAICK